MQLSVVPQTLNSDELWHFCLGESNQTQQGMIIRQVDQLFWRKFMVEAVKEAQQLVQKVSNSLAKKMWVIYRFHRIPMCFQHFLLAMPLKKQSGEQVAVIFHQLYP